MFAKRRSAFFEKMRQRAEDAVAVIPSTPVYIRNNDVDHEYRQDSDLYYLTGNHEPESVAVFDGLSQKWTLFVLPRDPDREVWDGVRYGVEGAKQILGADESFQIGELDEELPRLLANRSVLLYRMGRDTKFDAQVHRALDRTRSKAKLGTYHPTEVVEPGVVLHELRLRKSEDEIAKMSRAAGITKEAHVAAMAATRPGKYEYEVEAILLETFRKHGSERVAYGSIVGSGPNACVLHYRNNNRKMEDGDLLLIDAGCEFDYYASDVTRTFPVNGKFTKPQQEIYELVLDAQLASIEAVKPNATKDSVHQTSVEVITKGLVRLGILSGDVLKLIEDKAFKPFFMHGTSHWLGMDVHDVGTYYHRGVARPLEPGIVLTVEPGLYFAPADDRVPPQYRGIGVRIEDDILVTADGRRNLTEAIPKTVADLAKAHAG